MSFTSSENHEKQPLLTSESSQNYHKRHGTNESLEGSHFVEVNPGGLSVIKCAIFIIAQMAGSGILALPDAVSGTGWTGIFLIAALGSLACYCGTMLGKCWVIIRRDNNIPGHVRDPYPLIGYYAGGKKGKYVVEFCVMITLLGASVVFLLLSAREVSSILDVSIGSFNTQKTEFRIWLLVIGGILIPCTWFASPKEMWLFAYGASLCTIIACWMIVIRACMQIARDGIAPASARKDPSAEGFFNAFGTIAFAFGGGAIFPTFQADMEKPSKFVYSAILGFAGVLSLYMPVAILPYIGLGSNLDTNILTTMKNLEGDGHTLILAAECLITFHLLFAVIILNNPISQQIEEHIGIEHKFGWRRILCRSGIMLLVMGLAELFPNFGPVLSFIGASTVTMMSFILPAIFYLSLQHSELVPLHQKVFHYEIILISLIFGCAGIYSSVQGFSNPFKA
eukprot:TCONS_00067086-protein